MTDIDCTGPSLLVPSGSETDAKFNFTTHEHCAQCYTTTCRNPSRLRCAGYIPPAPTATNSCPLQTCPLMCGATYHACKESEHQELCARRRVPCINEVNGCTAVMPRAALGPHLKHCPASVVHCTMEWNRWPVFSTERQARVPFSQTNLHARYGQLDVALALRDQRVLSEGLRAPHSVRRALRNRLTERFPAVPLTVNRTSYNKTMALCDNNELPVNEVSIEGFRPVSASGATAGRNGGVTRASVESTETTTDDESLSDAPWVVRKDPPGLQRSIMATLKNSTDNHNTVPLQCGAEMVGAAAEVSITGAAAAVEDPVGASVFEGTAATGASAGSASAAATMEDDFAATASDEVNISSVAATDANISLATTAEDNTAVAARPTVEAISAATTEASIVGYAASHFTKYHNGFEGNSFSGSPSVLGQSLHEVGSNGCIINGSGDSHSDSVNNSSSYDNRYIVKKSKETEHPYENDASEENGDGKGKDMFVETNEIRLVQISNSYAEDFVATNGVNGDMMTESNRSLISTAVLHDDIASSVENEWCNDGMPKQSAAENELCNNGMPKQSVAENVNSLCDNNKQALCTVPDNSLALPTMQEVLSIAEDNIQDHESVERGVDLLHRAANGGNPSDLMSVLLYNNPCSSTLMSAEISKLPLVCDLVSLSQIRQSKYPSNDEGSQPPLISPLPLALQHILALDLNIESITRYQAKPRSMYTFLCAQPFRRDEYSWHFRNVHTDIHSGLNGWLEARCPLAQYGCTYSVRRLTPHGGTLQFSSVLDSFGFLPAPPLGKRVSCPKAATCDASCLSVGKEETNLVSLSCNIFNKHTDMNGVNESAVNGNDSGQMCNGFHDNVSSNSKPNHLLEVKTLEHSKSFQQDENIVEHNIANEQSEILSNDHNLDADSLSHTMSNNILSPDAQLSGKETAQPAVNGHDSRFRLQNRSHKEMTPEIYTSNDYDSAIRVNSGARKLLCKPYHSYIVQHSPPREEDILSSLPFEILQEITRYLDPYSLCNLALTSYYMRDVCRSIVEERGIVIQEWERFRKDGKYHWHITYQRWLFSTSFSPIDHWDLGDMSDMSEHLKVCPFLIRTQPSAHPVSLPALSSCLSDKDAAMLQKIYAGFDPKKSDGRSFSNPEDDGMGQNSNSLSPECNRSLSTTLLNGSAQIFDERIDQEDQRRVETERLFCSQFSSSNLGEYQSVLKNFSEMISRKQALIGRDPAIVLDDDDDDENYYSARSVCDDDGSEA